MLREYGPLKFCTLAAAGLEIIASASEVNLNEGSPIAPGNLACFNKEYNFERCCLAPHNYSSVCWDQAISMTKDICCQPLVANEESYNVMGPLNVNSYQISLGLDTNKTWAHMASSIYAAANRVRGENFSFDCERGDVICWPDSDCPKSQRGFVNWATVFLHSHKFSGQNDLPLFLAEQVIVVFAQISQNPAKELSDCPLGVAWVCSFCMNWAALKHDWESYFILSMVVNMILQKGGLLVGSSPWPIYHQISRLNDFHVLDARFRINFQQLFSELDQTSLTHLEYRNFTNPKMFSPFVQSVLNIIPHASQKLHGRRSIMFSFLYGSKLSSVTLAYGKYLANLGLTMIIFCGDIDCMRACQPVEESVGGLACLSSMSKYLTKFIALFIFLSAGIDALFLDFDAVVVQNPIPYLQARAASEQASVLQYGSSPFCWPGAQLVYAQSTNSSRMFFRLFLKWLHLHPYEFEQSALSSFLNFGWDDG